ncbi:MAG: NAD(P)-dependent dehydrogenase (short-subunit alcohol dehydrogenase family) [Bacteroidia bacterium]
MTDDDAVAAAVLEAENTHGVARVLVNCGGIATGAKTVGRENAAHPMGQFRKTIEINLIGTFSVITQFASRLAAAAPVGCDH